MLSYSNHRQEGVGNVPWVSFDAKEHHIVHQHLGILSIISGVSTADALS